MSSIVYITDRQMIEYHRINGNRTMNFWRPGSNRKVVDFHPGDLLFFLAKGTERGIVREKGIVGYGRYKQSHTMSFKQMWETYKMENGFANQEQFKEAVIKVSKDKELPKKLSSFYLTNVVYFQAPIYLSEIGVQVSNMIESFFYLDKEDPNATTEVLNKAKQIGIDTWMSMMNGDSYDESLFEEDATRHYISSAIQRLLPIYNETETKKAAKVCKNVIEVLQSQKMQIEMVKGVKEAFYYLNNNRIEIFVPLIANTKDINVKVQLLIGHAVILRNLLRKELKDYLVEVTLVIENTLTLQQQQLMTTAGINYLILDNILGDSESL